MLLLVALRTLNIFLKPKMCKQCRITINFCIKPTIKQTNPIFYLFYSKTGLVAAVVSKAIARWVRVSSSYPQSRPRGQQLKGASPLPVLPPVRETCRECCSTGFKKIMYFSKGESSKGDTVCDD